MMGERIKVAGTVLMADLLEALELTDVPDRLTARKDERLSFDEVEVMTEEVCEELPEELFSGELSEQLDQSDMMGLAEAIRCGDRGEAEVLLDRLFLGNPTIREWIDRGRYSSLARALKKAA